MKAKRKFLRKQKKVRDLDNYLSDVLKRHKNIFYFLSYYSRKFIFAKLILPVINLFKDFQSLFLLLKNIVILVLIIFWRHLLIILTIAFIIPIYIVYLIGKRIKFEKTITQRR